MASHKYAIKAKGKTLGIRDNDQLCNLLRDGKISCRDKVFVLDEKCWSTIADIEGFEPHPESPAMTTEYAEKNPESGAEERSVSSPLKTTKKDIARTDEFVELMTELSTNTELLAQSEAGPDDGDEFQVEDQKTIHKISSLPKRPARHKTTLVAAKVPNPERGWGDHKIAVLAAILIIVMGIAAGFFSYPILFSDGFKQTGTAILHAEKEIPETGAESD